MKLVRLKPINKRTGNLAKTYDFGGQIFRLGRWYKVDDAVAAKLAKETTDPYDASSAPVFDIFAADEALRIDRREKKAAAKKAGLDIPKEHADAPETESLTGIKEKPEVIKATEVESLADIVGDDDDTGDDQGEPEDPDDDDGDDDDDDDDNDPDAPATGEAVETGDLTTKDLPKPKTKRRKAGGKKNKK